MQPHGHNEVNAARCQADRPGVRTIVVVGDRRVSTWVIGVLSGLGAGKMATYMLEDDAICTDADLVLICVGTAVALAMACTKVRRDRPAAQQLVVSPTADHRMLVAAFEAQAHGFTSRDGGDTELVQGVEAVLRGEAYVPPAMLGGLLHELVVQRRTESEPAASDLASQDRVSALSRREREVLVLLTRGLNHQAIARELVISPQTARTHIQNVLGKLGVRSRLEAVALAVDAGLATPSTRRHELESP